MVRKKSKSKRVGLGQKYKIQKKCLEHKKKQRKAERLQGFKKKPKADPGVPNLWPFKDKIIAKLQRDKELFLEAKVKQKQQRNALLARLKRAQKETDPEETKEELQTEEEKNYAKRRWYFKEMKKVVEMSDVILEVVDARDPMGCRCVEIERRIQQLSAGGSSKRLVIVMNKIDLVPQEVVTAWVKTLRKEFPTVAFKASTQQQGVRLSQGSAKLGKASDALLNSNKSVGCDVLMQLLKNYCRSKDVKTAITVGIIGYPNVGKSSIINSLKRSKAAGVGATPGFTKEIAMIKIDKYVNMLDSPGVLFSPDCTQSDLVLRNCIKLEQCEDPIGAVQAIASRCPPEQLMQIYHIAAYGSPEEFISHVAHKRGKIKKGGVPDLTAASKSILKDWVTGEIPYYTLPPKAVTSTHDSATIVSSWAAEFDLNSLEDMMAREIATGGAAAAASATFVAMEANAPLKMADGNLDEEDDDDDDVAAVDMADEDEGDDEGEGDGVDDVDGANDADDNMVDAEDSVTQIQVAEKKQKVVTASKPQSHPIAATEQVNKHKKKSIKKSIKKDKKAKRKAESSMEDTGGDYNFATDFN